MERRVLKEVGKVVVFIKIENTIVIAIVVKKRGGKMEGMKCRCCCRYGDVIVCCVVLCWYSMGRERRGKLSQDAGKRVAQRNGGVGPLFDQVCVTGILCTFMQDYAAQLSYNQ